MQSEGHEQALIGELKAALHGVKLFLDSILNGSEVLTEHAQQKGFKVQMLVSKAIEKVTGYGKPLGALSPSPSANDLGSMPPQRPEKPGPTLPAKPAAQPPPMVAEEEAFEQENYEEMDAVGRPRIDTAGSIYAPMASVPMDEPEPITEETYEAMAPSPGHSGSGQVHHHVPPPAEPETEEMYTAMDAIEPPTTAPVATRPPPPSMLPPKPMASTPSPAITPIGNDVTADGFEQEEYTDMDAANREDTADDLYEAPSGPPSQPSPAPLSQQPKQQQPPPPHQQPPQQQQQQDIGKNRAQTLPSSSSYEDEDPYQYQIPTIAQKTSVESLSSASRRGYLDKLGGRGGKSWQKRFVVLSDGAMYYFEGEKDKRPRNVVPIMGYRVEEDPEHSKGKKYAFKMTPLTAAEKGKKAGTLKGKGGKVYCFRANSVDERREWVTELRVALVRANRRSTSFIDATVVEMDQGSGSGSIASGNSRQEEAPEEITEDLYEEAVGAHSSTPSGGGEIQDEYLMPAEIKSPAPSPSPQPEYLPPSDVSKPRAASTFGVPIDSTFADTSPYVSRKDANPYASRQQMKLPAPPAADQNPYQSRKSMALPKPPADQNPYASRQQMQLPKLPAAVHAPMAPKAPVAPASAPPPVDPTYVDTRAIFVQLHDAKFKYDQVFVALWDYSPSASDELGFKRGELVYIEDVLQEADWWVGRKKSVYDTDEFTGDRGLLVSAYVSPAYEKLI